MCTLAVGFIVCRQRNGKIQWENSRPLWLQRKHVIEKSENLFEQQINMMKQTFKKQEDELEMGRLVERLMKT